MRARSVAGLAEAVAAAVVCTAIVAVGAAAAGEPRSATNCGACHKLFKVQWEGSAHGTSWKNPVFRAFLEEAKKSLGSAVQPGCIACHAPAAHVAGDANVADPVSQEGVGCNFCHNIEDVDPSTKPASYTHDPSDPSVMRGPYRDSDARGGHKSEFSEIHTKSAFCAACHSAAHPRSGVIVEPTYLDWSRSAAAAKGRQCQDCHMPAGPGKASNIAKTTRPSVSAHTFVGPRTTPAWLDSSAALGATLAGKRLRLEVANRAAGHALPGGGNSMRTIQLDVVFRNGKGAEISRLIAERFGVEFSDADGTFPVPKWIARAVARSTSIPPDSSRVVWCDLPPGAATAEAVLTYHAIHPAYRPMLESRGVDLTGRAPYVMARAKVAIP